MHAFGEAFGNALAETAGAVVLSVILVVFAILAAALLFGGLFLTLAIIFYKKRKRKTFLLFGVLSSFFLSVIAAIPLSGLWGGGATPFFFSALGAFVFGVALVIRFYRKIHRG